MTAKKHRRATPSLEPQNITPFAWYYEDRRSLHFVVEHRGPGGNYCATVNFRVTASRLVKSLRRMGVVGK